MTPPATRPMFRQVTFLGDYPIILNGRILIIPDLDFRKSFTNYHKAEAFFAGVVFGATEEYEEHPSFTGKQSIQIALDHMLADPSHYLR